MLCYISENIDKISEGECKEFLDPEAMKKYVNKIDELQKMVDSKYNVNEKRTEDQMHYKSILI